MSDDAQRVTVQLELESYEKGVAVFAAIVPNKGRVALDLRLGLWRSIGQPGVLTVDIAQADAL